MKLKKLAALFGGLLTLGVAAGCGGGNNPLDAGNGGPVAPGTVVVGSANFSESVLIGEMYAQVLENAGATVQRQLNISTREVLVDQVKDGRLSVVPEYNGNLLDFLAPEAPATTTEEVNKELADVLPQGTNLLRTSEANDSNCMAVTSETAKKYNLKSLADLAPIDDQLTAGGGAEFVTRSRGLPGLKDRYGIEFSEYRSLDSIGPLTEAALEQGDIQVATLFTTAPSLKTKGFQCLDDPKKNFAPGNVVPFIHNKSVNDQQRAALNRVSDKLSTEKLIELVSKVTEDKQDTEDVAKEWLRSVGLLGNQ